MDFFLMVESDDFQEKSEFTGLLDSFSNSFPLMNQEENMRSRSDSIPISPYSSLGEQVELEQIDSEFQLKTIEMLALIKGVSLQTAYDEETLRSYDSYDGTLYDFDEEFPGSNDEKSQIWPESDDDIFPIEL